MRKSAFVSWLGKMCIRDSGIWAGRRREFFEQAVSLSQELNFTLLDEPLETVVVYLDPEHYKSTWLGNKAVYRTRMAIADDGELIICLLYTSRCV